MGGSLFLSGKMFISDFAQPVLSKYKNLIFSVIRYQQQSFKFVTNNSYVVIIKQK